jgi:hypothetical protein
MICGECEFRKTDKCPLKMEHIGSNGKVLYVSYVEELSPACAPGEALAEEKKKLAQNSGIIIDFPIAMLLVAIVAIVVLTLWTTQNSYGISKQVEEHLRNRISYLESAVKMEKASCLQDRATYSAMRILDNLGIDLEGEKDEMQ